MKFFSTYQAYRYCTVKSWNNEIKSKALLAIKSLNIKVSLRLFKATRLQENVNLSHKKYTENSCFYIEDNLSQG